MELLQKVKFEDIFNLKFFAKRFNIPLAKLSWGVVVSKAKGVTTYFPAIMIKGENLYINMSSDALAPLLNICGSEQKIYAATLKEINEETITFMFEDDKAVGFDKTRFLSIYRTKVFNKELAEEAQKL